MLQHKHTQQKASIYIKKKKKRRRKKIPDGDSETVDFREILWKTTELIDAPYSGGSEADCH